MKKSKQRTNTEVCEEPAQQRKASPYHEYAALEPGPTEEESKPVLMCKKTGAESLVHPTWLAVAEMLKRENGRSRFRESGMLSIPV